MLIDFLHSICVLVNVGSRNEKNGIFGISHFLEHLFFKGTSEFNSHSKILEEINKIGGTINAFTSFEYTGYYIIVPKQNYNRALYILHSLIFNSLIYNKDYKAYLENEIKKEKVCLLYTSDAADES